MKSNPRIMEIPWIDVKTAAHELISNYKGKDVSAGDAKKLEDAIRKCLVDDLGVSSSKVE